MKLIGKTMMMWAAAALLLVAPLSQAKAQTVKPVVVVAVSSVEDTLADVAYITKAAGAEDAGRTAMLFGNAFTSGIDKKKPLGMYVSPKEGGGDFVAVVFVPVTDLKGLLAVYKEQIGEPTDAGDGVLEVSAAGQSAFIKEQNGWAFVAQQKEHLVGLPADPAALLGALPKEYTVAVKVNVQNIPPELKKMAIDEMKAGFERGLESGAGAGPIDKELMEKLQRNNIDQMVRMVDELDELMVGYAVDSQGKRTYLDINVTAVEGSKLAKQMSVLADTKSSFAGFLMPGAAATMNLSQTMLKEDIDQALSLLTGVKENALKEIDNDPNLDGGKRAIVKDVLGSFMDVFTKTLEGGKLDGGAVLMLESKSVNFAAGGLVADGKQIETTFKKLVDLAKNEPDFPEVKLNAGQHGGITFHTLQAPIPDSESEARELFGEKVNIIIGTGPKAVYIAFGKDAEGLLKKVIDKSAADGAKPVAPMQMNVSLLPILKFAASMDDNDVVPALVSVLEKSGKDNIRIVIQPLKNGENIRFQLEEGVLEVIGEAVKRVGANFGPGAL